MRHENGDWKVRFDLCYPHLKLIIEYDGKHHLRDQKQWTRDLKRREWLDARGWRIIVINGDAFYDDPLETLQRIRNALTERRPRLPLDLRSPGTPVPKPVR